MVHDHSNNPNKPKQSIPRFNAYILNPLILLNYKYMYLKKLNIPRSIIVCNFLKGFTFYTQYSQ